MRNFNLNICQVSLSRDIPIILENIKSFEKIYNKNLRFYIICPNKQINEFRKKLNFKNVKIVDEDRIISSKKFTKIFKKLSKNILYKKKFQKRLSWYYQQILKIIFVVNFILKNNQNMIIWDADTVILKKIDFFHKNQSLNYGNFFEFNENYYLTNKKILKEQPRYHISFLNQFISMTQKECKYLLLNSLNMKSIDKNFSEKISKLILKKIFETHKKYYGSLFSEYELIGQSNYLFNRRKQKPLLFLRLNLDGRLSKCQQTVSKILNYKHVTYEHMHQGKKNIGMLSRKQSNLGLMKIVTKNYLTFYIKSIFHFFNYFLKFK